jgi:hypothetical protein
MKFLKFNFCHPLKVSAHLIPLTGTGIKSKLMNVASDESNLIAIPIDECSDGNWRIELEWDYDN